MTGLPLPDHSVTGHGRDRVYLLHGAFGAKEYWRHQQLALARAGYGVVAWDCPGYGLSPLPDDFGIESCAARLLDLIAATGGERNVVLGHSMGGMIAQRAYEMSIDSGRDLVHGLVLSATSAAFGNPDGDFQKEFVRRRVAPLDAGKTIPEFLPAGLRAMMAPGASGPAVDLLISIAATMPAHTFRAAISAIVGFEGRKLLPKIRHPVLCVAGGRDDTAPAAVMARMAEKIPAAEYRCMDDCGHFMWAEDVDGFNALLLDFLARHFGSPASRS